ncbi:hypothetical protein [Sandaracinobacteroides hominis]|uniref:hypothetical protein n=1 Tax=Sandaracinobacteroides hominis TaxID=2780086 RepID=UPI0018F758AD|nr:hypothetical protein [Sandaracinobacteroides hominis]
MAAETEGAAKIEGMPARKVTLALHKQVSWFDVRQLTATAGQTIASTIVGSMTGRRELMAALEPAGASYDNLAGLDEVWLDYVADCGDGWNASASVAWLVGRDGVRLAADGSPTPQPVGRDCRVETRPDEAEGMLVLPYGEALVLGGDQIYPTASAEGYQERLVGPLESARYYQEGGREVLAIPGNHDWYDGLTSFIRLFCQMAPAQRWMGAWQTRQRRSYFAAKLPHGWWLWGVDLALEDDFDPQQQDYFREQAKNLKRGDRLILVVPTPVWLDKVKPDPDDRKEYGKLGMVMQIAMSRGGISIPLILTGDSHFYSHHRDTKRDYIVCGGGGAFTLGTTQVPEKIERRDKRQSELKALFPDRADSAKMRWGALGFPWVNRAFSLTLGVVQMLGVWLLSEVLVSRFTGDSPFSHLFADIVAQTHEILRAPSVVVWALALIGGFAGFGASGARTGGGKAVPALVGAVHGLLYVLMALLAFELFQWLNPRAPSLWGWWGIVAGLLLLLSAVSGHLFGAYLAVSHWLLGMHNQETYSAQGIEDWKSFLKIHIRKDGATVYPIGLRRSARSWVPAPGVKERRSVPGSLVTRRSFQLPPGCKRILDPAEPLAPQLIEAPFACGQVEAAKGA